ncbi:MAG TPA: MurR/RpiR family transcriptional regulator [Firmicutes bacterium]|nr:MurR/RpiR family transcriptional regulator [Bacillota bacterium]
MQLAESVSLRACLVNAFDKLTPSQQKVATWLLTKGGLHPTSDLAQVAEQAGCSQSAVVRMCQALGMEGFREFRMRWAIEETNGDPKPILADRERIYHNVNMAVRETIEILDPEMLTKSAQYLSEARNCFIYGSGRSGLVGELAAAALSSVGCRAMSFSDTALLAMSYELVDENSIIFVVSHRGEWPEIIPRILSDRERGAKVIVLTSAPHSTLAKLADVLLLTGCPVGKDNRLFCRSAARIAQLSALQALVDTILALKAQ